MADGLLALADAACGGDAVRYCFAWLSAGLAVGRRPESLRPALRLDLRARLLAAGVSHSTADLLAECLAAATAPRR